MDENKDDDVDTSVEEKAAPILVDEVREEIRRLPNGFSTRSGHKRPNF